MSDVLADTAAFGNVDALLGSLVVRNNLDPDIATQAENIEWWLLTSEVGDFSLNGTLDDFQFWQREDLPIAPPSADYILYAQRGALRVFDPTGFPAQVTSGLVPESYRDMVYVYRITVCEDPATRERVVYNANDLEIWRQAAPTNYDPYAYLRTTQPWAMEQDTPEALEQRGIYDPSRIRCEYLLMPIDSLPTYAIASAMEAADEALNLAANPPAMMMTMQTMESQAAPMITAFTVDTNMVHLDISLTVGLLDSDVTNSITFAKVLPDNYSSYIRNGAHLPAIRLDKEEKALIGDVTSVQFSSPAGTNVQYLAIFATPADSTRNRFYEPLEMYDSGNPAFLLLGGHAVLLTVWTGSVGSPGYGTSVTALKTDINQMMSDLGGDYLLTEIDFSGFNALGN